MHNKVSQATGLQDLKLAERCVLCLTKLRNGAGCWGTPFLPHPPCKQADASGGKVHT